MARGGINLVVVRQARDALLARGENPSIDAVRVELGNTGSKTTIHRYLKELEDRDPRPLDQRESLSEELKELVNRLAERLLEEGSQHLDQAQLRFEDEKNELEAKLQNSQLALTTLQQQFAIKHVALETESAELLTTRTTLQAELTRNARLSQNCSDLELRVQEKDEHIRSLEEKHLHARDALEHYRNSVKEQREQEQRRHEGQLQQVQVELRQLQQMQSIKQDELSRLNRDNERLVTEARQAAKTAAAQEGMVERLTNEISSLKTTIDKAEGQKELLLGQIATLRTESKDLAAALTLSDNQASEAKRLLSEATDEIARFHLPPNKSEDS